MGVVKVDEQNKLTITYGGLQAPFGGLDASRQAPFIQPNMFAAINNFMPMDGELNLFGWQEISGMPIVLNGSTYEFQFITDFTDFTVGVNSITNQFLIGYVRLVNLPTPPYTRTNYFGLIKVSEFPGATPTIYELAINSYGGGLKNVTFKNINGILYISGVGFGTVLSYNGTALTNLNTTINGVPTGAAIISELNSRLLLLNTNTLNAGVYNTQPYQVAWSAETSYSQFEPLVGGLITGAGYNNLPDVEDQITGIINSGPTAYIIREQGITEMIPVNSGIQPYSFQHLSVSHKGIGALIPSSVAQYGTLGAFLQESGICLLTSGNFDNQFAGKAWKAINGALQNALDQSNNSANVQLIISPIILASETFPAILIQIYSTYTATPLFFIGNLNTGDWTQINAPTTSFALPQYLLGIINKVGTVAAGVNRQSSPVLCIYYNSPNVIGTNTTTFTIYKLYNNPNFTIGAGVTTAYPQPSLTFPVEEVSEYADVTIDSIVFWINLTANFKGSLNFYLNSALFGSFTGGVTGLQMVTIYPPNSVVTAVNPQLSITHEFGVGSQDTYVISKLTMYGTVNGSQRP